MYYDKIILGAGLYGFYSGLFSGKKKQKVLILETDDSAFSRATYINQARVHFGYHYPRSLSTAVKSAQYFERFNRDYNFCINSNFSQIYATSSQYSWTNAEQFQNFCHAANINCEEISPKKIFNSKLVDGAFLTTENTYDAAILKKYFLKEFSELNNVTIVYDVSIKAINQKGDNYEISLSNGDSHLTKFLLNTTYASTNQIISKIGFPLFDIKYELCEIILCKPGKNLDQVGITVMDGPFFSIMPFGKTRYHSLTAVSFTPHLTCYDPLPEFPCQKSKTNSCSPLHLENCNTCEMKPKNSWPYMSQLANKYLNETYSFHYADSLFSIKPILLTSEVDDSRPTVIRKHSSSPTFYSVLSGKINTIYDLDEVL
ncbi:MAG: amino acid oxidase [Vallitaleaceae bacterium]|nr:amino acid oxidase [Vallitaleaceae bacterium]